MAKRHFTGVERVSIPDPNGGEVRLTGTVNGTVNGRVLIALDEACRFERYDGLTESDVTVFTVDVSEDEIAFIQDPGPEASIAKAPVIPTEQPASADEAEAALAQAKGK